MTKNLRKISYCTFMILVLTYVLSPDSFDEDDQIKMAYFDVTQNSN